MPKGIIRPPHGGVGIGTRAKFLRRLGVSFAAVALVSRAAASASPAAGATPQKWKGRKDSKVQRWDVITIGNLSRNRYWGEGETKGVRSAICSCTLIRGKGFALLADPSLADTEQMAKELDRRTGLKLRDITAVFVSHEHGDHWAGVSHFTEARWLASAAVAATLNNSGKLAKQFEPASRLLFDAVEVLPTPGHTMGHHSLRFDCDGLSIVVAGDAVATQDYWKERRGYYNCVDFALSAQSMERIAQIADIVVPGHDNYFINV
jgi:glyoxylase-like metal-dependent hydrolase (beta-lactamase superfamily II)